MYENIDKSKYTPMMRQYLEIKEQYKDDVRKWIWDKNE